MGSHRETLLRIAVATTTLLSTFALAAASGAVPIAPGYSVTFVTTPGPAAGDVVVAGGALFVGIGSFGVGGQSLVRIDSGGTTVLATGFNSLGGLEYDAVGNRLLTGDNGGDQLGATTGDTVYEILNPFGSPATPANAIDIELLPMGSVPGYSDLALDPSDPSGNSLFIGDSAFAPGGRILSAAISSQTTSVVQTGLSFTGGLASDGASLFFGEAIFGSGGDLYSVPLGSPSDPRALVANVLAGHFDLETAGNGSLLTSGGSDIVRVDPGNGAQTTVATGFGFTGGVFEDPSGTIYALDGFPSPGEENRVWILTPVPEPGGAVLVAAGLALLSRRRQSGLRSVKRTGTATRP
jgi:hypothetical protein